MGLTRSLEWLTSLLDRRFSPLITVKEGHKSMKICSALVMATIQLTLLGCGDSSGGGGENPAALVWAFSSPPAVTGEEALAQGYELPEYYPSVPINGTGVGGETGHVIKLATAMPPEGYETWTTEQKVNFYMENILDTYYVTADNNNHWEAGSDDEVGFFTYLLSGPGEENAQRSSALAVVLPEAP